MKEIGGKPIHPVLGLPGGVAKAVTEEVREQVREVGAQAVEFAKFTLDAFNKIVLSNKEYVDLILSDVFYDETYYMGMVDPDNRVNPYDGRIRVVNPEGKQVELFKAEEYLDVIDERVEEWSYIKFPYLKKIGWKGFNAGMDSGIVRVAPLARLNASEGMATPLAQAEYERLYETLGGKPAHNTLAFHWARLVEIMYSAEMISKLAKAEELTSPDIRNMDLQTPSEGIGAIEAPRGTLIHHYNTDERGIITQANLIVATVFNSAPICMSIEKAAKKLIKGGKVDDGLLNMVEMAFRAYDPCFSCATHSLPGSMPLEVRLVSKSGELIEKIVRS